MSTEIKRLGELRVDDYVEGINNNWLVYKPLPRSKMHSSGLDVDIVISATPSIQVVDVDLDLPLGDNLYSYSIGNDNKLKIAFDKNTFTGRNDAIDKLACLSVTYEQGVLTMNGNLFVLVVRNSMGVEIHRTTPQTLDNINILISTFNNTRATDFDGSLDYVVTPDYLVS